MRCSNEALLPPETCFHEGHCPLCGLQKEKWSNAGAGYIQKGETFCCKECVDGSGCICVGAKSVVAGSGVLIDTRILPERRTERHPWPPKAERRSAMHHARGGPCLPN